MTAVRYYPGVAVLPSAAAAILGIGFGLGLFLAPAVAQAGYDAVAEPTQISVSGRGEVAVVPDIAVLTASVREADRAPEEALSAASSTATDVIAKLTELGVQERDIATRSVSFSPIYHENSRIIRGWQASSTLVIKLRRIGMFGPAASALAELGIKNIRGPSLQVGAPDLHRQEARAVAMADARDAADQLAAEAGLVITGALSISLSEGGGYAPVPYARMEMAVAAADRSMPVAAGEQMITSRVQVVWDAVPITDPADD